jgi:hypothetical protein
MSQWNPGEATSFFTLFFRLLKYQSHRQVTSLKAGDSYGMLVGGLVTFFILMNYLIMLIVITGQA